MTLISGWRMPASELIAASTVTAVFAAGTGVPAAPTAEPLAAPPWSDALTVVELRATLAAVTPDAAP